MCMSGRWWLGMHRSLIMLRGQGKPKKISPLCERINNSNIHKVPKTPKRVTWPARGPVTGTKRFVKHEAMSHPSPASMGERCYR